MKIYTDGFFRWLIPNTVFYLIKEPLAFLPAAYAALQALIDAMPIRKVDNSCWLIGRRRGLEQAKAVLSRITVKGLKGRDDPFVLAALFRSYSFYRFRLHPCTCSSPLHQNREIWASSCRLA